VLVHVVDCATLEPGRDPVSDVDALELELSKYTPGLGGKLEERPRVVVLNKIDVPEAAELAEFVRPEFEARGLQVFEISTASRKGLRELTFALAKVVEQYREMQPVLEPETIVLRPLAVDDQGFTVEADPEEEGAFIVRGTRPERWIRQTSFGNDEAVGYLADRLNRLGVEDKLAKLGARPGSPVTIGDVQFEWEPSTPSVAMHLSGRGTDVRLENHDRIGASERKEARRIRRDGPDEPEGDDLDLDA
jgi:GTP-binding protein